MSLEVYKKNKPQQHYSAAGKGSAAFNEENEKKKSVSIYNLEKRVDGLAENAENEIKGSAIF